MEFISWMLYRPDAIEIWRDEDVKHRLSWYYMVMKNIKPAKFLIAKSIESLEEPSKLDYAGLWDLHDQLAKEFRKLFEKIKRERVNPNEIREVKASFLDVKIAIVRKMLEKCIFCERKCLVNRAKGEKGFFCRLNGKTYVHSWFHHLGEEAPLVPSGTIFYGSCNFKCVFCIDEDDFILAKINGLVRVLKVKELANYFKNENNVEVLTPNGWSKVNNIIERESNKIYLVKTNRGRTVRLTPEHLIIIINRNGLKEIPIAKVKLKSKIISLNKYSNKFISSMYNRALSEINLLDRLEKIDDKLERSIRVKNARSKILQILNKENITFKKFCENLKIKCNYYWLNHDSFPLKEFMTMYMNVEELRKAKDYVLFIGKNRKYSIPIILKLTPKIMRLLGYFLAKGTYMKNYGLVFKVKSKLVKDILSCIASIVHSPRSKIIVKQTKNRVFKIMILNKPLYVLLKYVFGIRKKMLDRELPWIIFNVKRNLLKEFLSAYLTSNGIMRLNGKKETSVEFIAVSERIRYGLSYILGLHGIQFRIASGTSRGSGELQTAKRIHRIMVEGENEVKKLLKIAKFLNEKKWRTLKPRLLIHENMEENEDDYIKEKLLMPVRKRVYDIVLESSSKNMEDHTFFAGDGILIHNCQNWDISQEDIYNGIIVGPLKLALMQKTLRQRGARNINHVGGDPTPNLHTIVESLKYLDINVPQLWNSNMYLSVESMKILVDLMDIWLPDFKYGNNKCAVKYSGVSKYFEVVTRNLKLAIKHGDMIIRHLVLPNHIECCTKPILKWISANLPKNKVLVNIMGQYRPEYQVLRSPEKWPNISRSPSRNEMKEAYSYAKKLGLRFEPVS